MRVLSIARRRAAPRWNVIDGTISVPQGIGLGIEIDRTRIEAYQAK